MSADTRSGEASDCRGKVSFFSLFWPSEMLMNKGSALVSALPHGSGSLGDDRPISPPSMVSSQFLLIILLCSEGMECV